MRLSSECCLTFLVSLTIIDIIYASHNDTLIEGNRRARVSGRIEKLYSGAKPDPVVCLSEGLQKDNVDCSVYYYCYKTPNGKYTVYRFQCGPGTVYDPEIEVCNHPRRTKRLECGGLVTNKRITSTEGYLENEIDEKENQELPSPLSSKLPTIDSSIYTITASPSTKLESSYITTFSPVHKLDETMTVSPSFPIKPNYSTTKSPREYLFALGESHTPKKPNSMSGDLCSTDGFIGDSVDCRKFYRCVNNQRGGYIRYEFSCSDSTVWDDDTKSCNHPWAVQRTRCGTKNIKDKNSISYANQINYNKEASTTTVQKPVYDDSITQTQYNNPDIYNLTQINFGDRLNTVKPFVKQNQSVSYIPSVMQSGPQPNYGNVVTQSHLSVEHVETISEAQTHLAELSTSTTTTTKSTQYTKDGGSNKCEKDGFMGDSSDCRIFYRCVRNGKEGFNRYEFSCSEGTLWDDKLEACNHAWAVKECGKKLLSPNTASTATTVIKPVNDYYTTVSSSVFNNEIEDEPGYNGQNNHKVSEQSKLSTYTMSVAVTESSNLYETDCKSNGFFGKNDDCSKFYRCVENGKGGFTKYEYKCGDGTVWDPEIESCNHGWKVNHCSNNFQKVPSNASTSQENTILTTVSLIQTTTQKYFHENDYDSGYSSLQRETSPQLTSTEKISYQDNNCKTTGFMGDKNDCKKFYRCVENGQGSYIKYEFSCGEGTVWDSKIEACNHAWAVKECGGSAMNDNNSNQIMTTHSVPNNSEDDNSYITHSSIDPEKTTTASTSTKTTSAISESNKCQTEGFMGNSNDCKTFYRCVANGNGGYIQYEFTCGDGTVWDPKIAACNHAWAVENCGGSTSENYISPSTQGQTHMTVSIDSENLTETTTQKLPLSSSTVITPTMSDRNNLCVASGFMGDKNDCKKFYRCVDDGKGTFTRYEFTCGEGTVWDPKIDACNHAWAVESCGDYVTSGSSSTHRPITVKDEETDNSYVTPSKQESKETESSSWSTTIKSTTATAIVDSQQCNEEGFMADNNDCKKFYRCVNDGKGSFHRYEFTCGEGTVWDSEINSCNHINSVKSPCKSILSTTTTESSQIHTSTFGSSIHENNDYSTTSTTTIQSSQSQRCKHDGFIGDQNDCRKFYRCTDNGQGGFYEYQFTCAEGTIWDQKILACNHALSEQDCNLIDTGSHTSNNNTSESYSTTVSVTEMQSTEKTDSYPSKDECVSEGFFANTNDCKKFFRCVDDSKGGFTKYDFTCGDGTVWVQNIQACDHDVDKSNCSKSTEMPPIHSNQDQPTKATSTPSSNNPTLSTTYNDYDGPTSHKPVTSNNDCQSEGYYPNKNDCKQYYQCVNNGNGGYHKYEFSCSEGTAWDINTQSCNHISEVEGCQDLDHDAIQSKPTMQDEPVSQSSSTTDASFSSTTTSSNNQDTCEEAGYFGNSKDCKKFYRCVDNGKGGFTKYDFTCGEGTIWDQDVTTCNHPENVLNPSCTSKNSNDSSTTTPINNDSSETTKSTTSSDSSITTQSTTSENSNQSTETVSSVKPNNNDNSNYTCTSAGFFADPNNCKKFYRCVDWGNDGKSYSVFHFDCGEGTIWDQELQTCNYEDSVYPPRNCSGNQSQNENNNNNTTTSTEETTNKQEETTSMSTTTTESSSTTDQTSTQQQSSTQQSTTVQSSTQQSTTEQSSTQQSTTEQSTTQQVTSEQSTTQQSTTEESTTQQSTTEQSTTQQSTTEESTTQKSTTEQSTTQQSTTEQSTTQKSTTEQGTTQQSTTDQSTTQQSTTEQSTTEQSTTEKSTTQQSTTEQSTTEQSTTEKSTTQQSTTEQSTTQQSSTEQSTTEQSTTELSSTTEESTTSQSTTSESTTTTVEQTTKAEQTTTQESTSESTSESQSSTTEQSSTTQESTTENSQNTTTEKPSSEKECPQTDDDQYLFVCPTGFRRHPKYCNLFYQCSEEDDSHEMKVAIFNCPNNTIYDESKVQCVEEAKADKKCEGEIAQKRRIKRLDANYKEPITVSREPYSCGAVGHFPFEKNEECSPVLFKCEVTRTGKLRGLVYQCPDGYVYWSISRRCEPIKTMTDCKRSFTNWTERYEIPTERKNVAKK